MNKVFKFGEDVPGYDIPVLNEREIRAAAGILFLGMFICLVLVLDHNNFVPIKFFITGFLTDFIIRIFISPRYSPTLIIGRLIVRNQTSQYVGAAQKKFAWIIGLVLSSLMFTMFIIINAFGPPTGITCLICLIFTFFETAFGICLGCKVYSLVYRKKAQYCPGEVCDVKSRQDIQKTSGVQLLIVLGFVAYIYLLIHLFGDRFGKKPHDLFGMFETEQVK